MDGKLNEHAVSGSLAFETMHLYEGINATVSLVCVYSIYTVALSSTNGLFRIHALLQSLKQCKVSEDIMGHIGTEKLNPVRDLRSRFDLTLILKIN